MADYMTQSIPLLILIHNLPSFSLISPAIKSVNSNT
jgi:hypothetical protein